MDQPMACNGLNIFKPNRPMAFLLLYPAGPPHNHGGASSGQNGAQACRLGLSPSSSSLTMTMEGSESIDMSATSQDTREQEIRKGKTVLESTEQMREELVQSAVTFLKHPKVVTSSDTQRRSFLENKGLSVDEINEAFRRLQGPSSNPVTSNTFTFEGMSDHSCRYNQETKVGTKCMDESESFEPETEAVAPVLPCHPKSYMEIMEMIQRGERPDDIQDINDDPPNPDQPISKPRMAPKPKPWEKQDQENCTLDLKSPSSDSSKSISEVQNINQSTESASGSNQEDSLLQAEVVEGSESPTDDAASSK